MSKPVSFTVAMFLAMIVTTFARSYFTEEQIYWWIESVSALGVAAVCYAIAQRLVKKAKSDNSGTK